MMDGWKCNICNKFEMTRMEMREHVKREHRVASRNVMKDIKMSLGHLYRKVKDYGN